MSKIALILQVNDYLRRRGLSPLKNLETDLYLKCFYNRAEHGRNEGKVQYEALIRFDVKVRTVFFWDNVSLIESGQTSLSSSGRYHRYCLVTNQTNDLKQSIPTEFNLAEIPEFIRMAAKNNGWKFKAVFNRGDALYPSIVNSKDQDIAHIRKLINYSRKYQREFVAKGVLQLRRALDKLLFVGPF